MLKRTITKTNNIDRANLLIPHTDPGDNVRSCPAIFPHYVA